MGGWRVEGRREKEINDVKSVRGRAEGRLLLLILLLLMIMMMIIIRIIIIIIIRYYY